jgi:hypothetical protein
VGAFGFLRGRSSPESPRGWSAPLPLVDFVLPGFGAWWVPCLFEFGWLDGDKCAALSHRGALGSIISILKIERKNRPLGFHIDSEQAARGMFAIGRRNAEPWGFEEFALPTRLVGDQVDKELRVGSFLFPARREVGECIDSDARPTEVFLQVVGVAAGNGPRGPDIQEDTTFAVLEKIANDDFLGEDRVPPRFGQDSGSTRKRLSGQPWACRSNLSFSIQLRAKPPLLAEKHSAPRLGAVSDAAS